MKSQRIVQRPYGEGAERLQRARTVLAKRLDSALPGSFAQSTISLAESGSVVGPHQKVVDALMRAISDPTVVRPEIYYTGSVLPELFRAARSFFRESCAIPWITDDSICIGGGVSNLLDAACYALVGPGDGVLTVAPYYHAFAEYPRKWQADFHFIGVDPERGLRLTPQMLRAWFQSNPEKAARVKVLVLFNPSIVGTVYSQAEADALVACAQDLGLCIFVDEIYRDAVYDGNEMGTFARSPGAEQCVLTAHSGSKTRGIADLRVGWMCGPTDIIQEARHYIEHSTILVSTIAQHGAAAALRLSREELSEERSECALRAAMVARWVQSVNQQLGEPRLSLPEVPAGGHGILLGCTGLRDLRTPQGRLIDSCEALCEWFMQPFDGNAGVVVGPGVSLGLDGLYVRIAFAEIGASTPGGQGWRRASCEEGRALLEDALSSIAAHVAAVVSASRGRSVRAGSCEIHPL